MHSTVLSKGIMFKWAIPIVVVAALLIGLGLIVSGGSSEGGLGDAELTDFNPAYQSDLIGPAEGATGPGGVYVLYSIEVAEQTNTFSYGTGTLATITVTNNIAEPIANSTTVNHNGDIRGNVVLTADYFGFGMPTEGVLTYADATAANSITIATFPDIVVHPGKSVVFQVPVTAPTAMPATFINAKAEFVGATTSW